MNKSDSMNLFEKLGRETVVRIDTLQRKKKILAVHHQTNGTCLVLKDCSKLILEGLSEDDSRKLVGYLGFFGHGEHGLDTPAFAVKPDVYPDPSIAN